MHNKWAKKAGIDEFISDYVNRDIDYGTSWAYSDNNNNNHIDFSENKALQQLQFFYQKDVNNKSDVQNSYAKAFFLHHLLDFFCETRVNVKNIDLVFQEFLRNKVIIELTDFNGNKIDFQKDIDDLFKLIKDNKEELYEDLK